MKEMRTAIYCRVDSGGCEETRRMALDHQRAVLQDYAEKKDILITGYYEDDGYPGDDMKRPGLVKLLEDSRAGHFDRVLVADSGRLYRGSCWEKPQWPFQVCSLNPLEHGQIR